MSKGWTLWAQRKWTDPEPDTFTVSVESSEPNSRRHVVVSGNATWLTAEQAREVRDFLLPCIRICEDGPQEEADDVERSPEISMRELFASEREQRALLNEDGFRVDH